MLLVKDFIEKIKPFIKQFPSEPVELSKCLGRVIGDNVISRCSIPYCNISIMSGYAIKSSDTQEIPTQFKIIGKSTPSEIHDKPLKFQEAIHLLAGSPIPEGADTVIPESTVHKNGLYITLEEHITIGANIAYKGIDIERGDILFQKGTLITARHISNAASAKIPWLPVIRQPKVGIIVAPEETLCDTNANHANNALIACISSLVTALGAIPINLGISVDNNASIEEVLSFKNEARFGILGMDLIIIAGSTQRPQNSLLWNTLVQFGAKLDTYEVSIGNVEKVIIGNYDGLPLVGLPSNIIASNILSILFLKPTIAEILSYSLNQFQRRYATLSRNLDAIDKCSDYLYAYLNNREDGTLIVTPFSAQDCLMHSTLNKADCIIVIDHSKELIGGSTIEIIMCSGSIFHT